MNPYHLRSYMDNKLSQYTRKKLLGEGGMGKVYLAQDNVLQRQVAIKELTFQEKSQAKDEKVNHVLTEARLLARVNHLNIIQIYNIHEEDKHLSLVMEYFNSKTLTQFQKEACPTLLQKLDLLRQLSAGLAAAHNNGVIHCDLKPSNILVNEQGQLKIADFGIARLMPSETNIDPLKSNQPAEYGCLFYMSPEQIKQQTVDYRSDIFSFGIIAYQLMVGSHPFAYANVKNNVKGNAKDNGKDNYSAAEVADKICEYTPEHAKNVMLDAPSALTDLLMAMLVKSVEQRTLTAAEIENRLKHIQRALQQNQFDEQPTLPLVNTEAVSVEQIPTASTKKWQSNPVKFLSSLCLLCLVAILFFLFFNTQQVETKQVVILRPTLTNSPLMAAMQQDLVISAIEDALRQSVINTKDMYLVSQREVNAISKAYPDDLKKLKQAVGASDIISTRLECDNHRCKVSFSRLVTNSSNPNNTEMLVVKSEKNWLTPIDKFNGIYSTSQMQFVALFPQHPAVNQAGLEQHPINEDDYRSYLELYSQIKGQGNYSAESLTQLEALLTRSPYLYAAYSLYRDTALDLYWDSKNKKYFKQLDVLLQNSPPEYRYSAYEAIERFWLFSDMKEVELAKQQITEAQQRGADDLIILELKAYMFFNTGQYKKAADAYTSAFKLRPSSTLLNNIAFSYWRMGDLDSAESALNKMLKITPKNYRAKRLQANIWLVQGRLELAITAYEKIVNRLNNGKDITNLSLAYALNKQYNKSLEAAQRALKLSPKHPFKLLNLADIEMILGNKQSAISHYQQVVTTLIGKDKVKYLTNLAQAYGQLNQANLAIDALSKAHDLAPENGEVSYASALVYSLLKEQASAIHHVKTALKYKVGVVWFNLPWFDELCVEPQFQQLMTKFDNASRCSI